MTDIYVYNTSSDNDRIKLAPLDSIGNVLEEVPPGEIPSDQPAVIYIVGHGVPDGLSTESSVIPEAAIANELQAARGTAPTLVIFDTCFSESFSLINGKRWPENFELIFSCRSYERSWHNSDTQTPPRVSLFSIALCKVLKERATNDSSGSLQKSLRDELSPIQTPVVNASEGFLKRLFFGAPGAAARQRTALPAETVSDLAR